MSSVAKTWLACISLGALTLLYSTADAALILQWSMDNPTPQNATVGSINLVGGNVPTFLPTGGANGTGAYQFNGTNNYFNFSSGVLYPDGGSDGRLDWTASFWIKTTDTGTGAGAGNYAGTPKVPVFGDASGLVEDALGLDGGKVTATHYAGGWHTMQGNTNVADGGGHYVTIVHHDTGDTLDYYVDGVLDAAGLPAFDSSPWYFRQLGTSYPGGSPFANMTLDDVRLYDNALSASEIFNMFAPPFVTPEPSSIILFAAVMCMACGGIWYRRRRAMG